jgi:hypothetical protein
VQADWKPEAPESFGDIADLTTSLSSIKIDETKKQGSCIILCSMLASQDQLLSPIDL